MTDLALVWQPDETTADLVVAGNDLLLADDLQSSVLISLFSDRRAPDDVTIDGDDRRGWWADTWPEIEGDELGSLLWTLERATLTQETVLRAQQYARDALSWMITDGVASRVDVAAEIADRQRLDLAVTVTLADGAQRRYGFALGEPTGTEPSAGNNPGEVQGTGGPGPIVADPYASAEPGVPGEVQGTGGPGPIVADPYASAEPGVPGEVQGTGGPGPIAADPYASAEPGVPGEVQGTGGPGPIVADPYASAEPGVPGEVQGTGGPGPIVADPWVAAPPGLAGEAGCGETLAPPPTDDILSTPLYPVRAMEGVSGAALVFGGGFVAWPTDPLSLVGEVSAITLTQVYFPVDYSLLEAGQTESDYHESLSLSGDLTVIRLGTTYVPVDYSYRVADGSTYDPLTLVADITAITLGQVYDPVDYLNWAAEGLVLSGDVSAITLGAA